MIQIRDLHKYFGPLHVLKGINLEVKKGEVLSVIGSSGSGKSTLLYCINGLETIQKGDIIVNDIPPRARAMPLHAKHLDWLCFAKLIRHDGLALLGRAFPS